MGLFDQPLILFFDYINICDRRQLQYLPGPPFLWGDLTLRRASLTIVKIKQPQRVFKAVFAWLAGGKFPAWALPGGRPPDRRFKRSTLQPLILIP